MNAGETIVLSTLVSLAVSYCMGQAFLRGQVQEESADEAQRPPQMVTETAPQYPFHTPEDIESHKQQTLYAVSGTPRHVPWHIRRKEREAASRTKRAALESFREAE